jgi:Domain of unknown function (DUF4037)
LVGSPALAEEIRQVLGNELGSLLAPADWLAMPEQHLRTVASGGVWHDGTGELERAWHVLRWYPRDVWRCVLAAQWRRIEQEEAFPAAARRRATSSAHGW